MIDQSTVPHAARPAVSTVQQWWVLTARMITPTLRNGELATQVIGSIVFTIGYYLPLKQLMGAVQPLSNYAQYLTPLIVLQAIWFAAVSAAYGAALATWLRRWYAGPRASQYVAGFRAQTCMAVEFCCRGACSPRCVKKQA